MLLQVGKKCGIMSVRHRYAGGQAVHSKTHLSGDVPKWLKGPHSKCGRRVTARGGSNPSISAKHPERESVRDFCLFPQANRKQTRSKTEANRKQTGSKPQANRKQTGSEGEKEIETEIEVEDECPPLPPAADDGNKIPASCRQDTGKITGR